MTRTLILMRHAKSDWDTPGPGDHARLLSARGRNAAKALGDWLRQGDLIPDQVLCSSAARTRETLGRLRLSAPTVFSDRLYLADRGTLLAQLRHATGQRVLMLGHNPGIAEFADAILRARPDHPRFTDYPTGATLLADFDIADWGALRWGSGQPRTFVIPRELMSA